MALIVTSGATLYVAGAGFFFMLANIIMKTMATTPPYVLYPAITIASVLGVWCEIEALKTLQLGLAVAFLLIAETAFSFLIGVMFLREGYSMINVIGLGMVIGGMVFLNIPPDGVDPQSDPTQAETIATAADRR
jgi:multidrug transporter EmrE-like cation transporter